MNRWLYLAAGVIITAAGFWLTRRGPFEAGSPAVVAQIQQMNELSTVNYTVQKVIGLTEEKTPVGSESILIVIQAKVRAGVDLAGLQPRDVTARADGALVGFGGGLPVKHQLLRLEGALPGEQGGLF